MESFNDEQRSKLLQWATGTSRVPVEGFSALQSNDGRPCTFNLRLLPPGTRYQMPVAHTCFNRIDMPLYGLRYGSESASKKAAEEGKATLRAHLLGAILDPAGFTQD